MASTADKDSVRRLIYGGSTRSGSLSTADINSFIDEEPNVWLAASAAANAEAIKSASGGRKKVGDLEVDPGATAAMWQALGKRLRVRGVRSVRPFSGGVSVSRKDSDATDTDWDRPASNRGQFDYPGGT